MTKPKWITDRVPTSEEANFLFNVAIPCNINHSFVSWVNYSTIALGEPWWSPFADVTVAALEIPTEDYVVTVADRLPSGENGDLDDQGRCWWGDAGGQEFVPSWRLCKKPDGSNASAFTHWRPHWAMPTAPSAAPPADATPDMPSTEPVAAQLQPEPQLGATVGPRTVDRFKTTEHGVYALCTDGSMFYMRHEQYHWRQLPPIPQP
jgi:hypothetical protein